MDDKSLYDDKFLKILTFTNGPKFTLFLGTVISLLLLYLHWFASVIFFIITIILAAASYMAFKDKRT